MKRRLLLLAAIASPTLSAAAPSASFADAAKRHRAGDTAAAMAFWVPLAQKGDANAAFNLGTIHQHGDGVARNPTEALKWYRIAAEKGDRESQSRLGAMYLNGEGTPKDEKEGWRWINAHRLAHAHHDHDPQIQAWRKQASELIAARDMRENLLASRRNGDKVLADLRRRAGMSVAAQAAPQFAAGQLPAAN